jgi:hypothetical protein
MERKFLQMRPCMGWCTGTGAGARSGARVFESLRRSCIGGASLVRRWCGPTALRWAHASLRPTSTVFAPSTAPGKAAIAVVRVSGPNAKAVLLRMLTQPQSGGSGDSAAANSSGGSGGRSVGVATTTATVPPLQQLVAGKLRRAHLHCPASGVLLDDAMVVWFPGPRTYTGEDVVELHLHGGRAVVNAVLKSLAEAKVLAPLRMWLGYAGCAAECAVLVLWGAPLAPAAWPACSPAQLPQLCACACVCACVPQGQCRCRTHAPERSCPCIASFVDPCLRVNICVCLRMSANVCECS